MIMKKLNNRHNQVKSLDFNQQQQQPTPPSHNQPSIQFSFNQNNPPPPANQNYPQQSSQQSSQLASFSQHHHSHHATAFIAPQSVDSMGNIIKSPHILKVPPSDQQQQQQQNIQMIQQYYQQQQRKLHQQTLTQAAMIGGDSQGNFLSSSKGSLKNIAAADLEKKKFVSKGLGTESNQSVKSLQNMMKNNQHLAAAVGGPMFFEMFGQQPQKNASIIKKVIQGSNGATIGKTQKIKIGLHKKAISLAKNGPDGVPLLQNQLAQHALQNPNTLQPTSTDNKSQMKHSNSKKKVSGSGSSTHGHHSKQNSYGQQNGQKLVQQATAQQNQANGHHKQTSIHEYNSNNNNNIIVMNYGGDVQIFPKIDNFIIGSGQSPEKGSGATSVPGQSIPQVPITPDHKKQMMIEQTHMMQMKNYQRIINDAQQTQTLKSRGGMASHDGKAHTHQAKPSILSGGIEQTPGALMKSSFDSTANRDNQRAPANTAAGLQTASCLSQSTTGHPSQRISIISSSLGEQEQEQQQYNMLQLSAPINNSRAQVHYQGNGANMQKQYGGSMQIAMKHHSSNYVKNMPTGYTGADNQLLQLQSQEMSSIPHAKDHETVLHDSPPPNTKIFSSSNGGTVNQRQIKKSLQHHHQRTFSDIPPSQAVLSQNMKAQMAFAGDNQSLIQTANSGAILNSNTMSNSNRLTMYETDTHHQIMSLQTYDDKSPPQGFGRDGQQQHFMPGNNHRKIVKSKAHMQSIDSTQSKNQTTNGLPSSSRQAINKHSHQMTEDREALMNMIQHASSTSKNRQQHHKGSPSLVSGNEIKSIYQGILKDQIQKTKQALKLTQTQFGSHSRKVVSNAAKLNPSGIANTQSFRISQQTTITQGSISGGNSIGQSAFTQSVGPGSISKNTPKIYLSKTKKHTKQPSINNSSQGARASNNITKLQSNGVLFLNDGRIQKIVNQGNSRAQEASSQNNNMKAIYTHAGIIPHHQHTGTEVSLNFQGALSDIMARTSTKAALMKSTEFGQATSNLISTQKPKLTSEGGGHHKRSVSDSNAVFTNFAANQSNRAQSGAPQVPPGFESSTIQFPSNQIYKSTQGSITGGSTKKSKHSANNSNMNVASLVQAPTQLATQPSMLRTVGNNIGFLNQSQAPQPSYDGPMRSTFHKDVSVTKINTMAVTSSGPYDLQHRAGETYGQQQPSLRPHSGVRVSQNSYPLNNEANTQMNQSQRSSNRSGSHRHVGSAGAPPTKLSAHYRNHSHQITIDSHKQSEQIVGSNMTVVPKPPAAIQQKHTLQKQTIPKEKLRRMSSKNNGAVEIIIEDQGITPNNLVKVATPQSLHNEEQPRVGTASSGKAQKVPKSGKDKLISILSKKEQQSRRQTMDQRQSDYNNNAIIQERFDTQDSAMSDPNLSPRTKKNVKLSRMIKFAFHKTNQAPVTNSEFYKIGKVMGKGAFGKVNLAIHRLSGKFVALKSINKTFLSEEASKRKVMQEFNILQRTRHKNIVRLYESFETPQHIVFVMEVCGAGDLLTYVRKRRKLKEDVAKHLFKGIVEGLRYCHARGILHRDIKLDNILLTSEGDIKICDFGVSKLVKPGETLKEQCGTPAYIAPEVFEGQGYEGFASDVWSAGVVLYAMLYGTVPFKASNMTELQRQICKGNTTFKDEISPESINLLQGILEKNPGQRLSIAEILRHPWMQNIPKNINVFTDQEKEKTNQEFAYYNMKGDNQNDEAVPTDPFAEQMSLNSTQNSLVKNVSTKSVILAPFNSTRTHIDENFHLNDSIQDLMVDRKVIKFAAKVKEVDRQYEANNNAELDNGVYHQEDDENGEEQKGDQPPKPKEGEMPLRTDLRQDDESLQREIEEGQKLKKQSEWQKIERAMIKKQRNEEETHESQVNMMIKTASLNAATANLVINQEITEEIERTGGFPKAYTIASLNNDDLNYATAYYYLLCTVKEY